MYILGRSALSLSAVAPQSSVHSARKGSGADVRRGWGADGASLVQEAGFDHVKALYVDNFDGLTGT